MGLIGISGHMGSGKDLTGAIIQMLLDSNCKGEDFNDYTDNEIIESIYEEPSCDNTWQIKKFADKLKDCVCLVTGCSRDDLEDPAFKNTQILGYGGVWLVYTDKYQDTPYDPKWFKSTEEAEIFLSNENCVCWHDITPATLTFRQLLQQLGTNVGRIIHPDMWVNALMSEYTPCVDNTKIDWSKQENANKSIKDNLIHPNWIITDMRFPNELKAVKDREGITIRVNRTYSNTPVLIGDECDGCTAQMFEDARPKHESETALDNATFDYTIENNGTIKELIEKIREILIKEKLL